MKIKTASSPARTGKEPACVLRAGRALQRAARGVKKQSKARGLPLVIWENDKVRIQPT